MMYQYIIVSLAYMHSCTGVRLAVRPAPWRRQNFAAGGGARARGARVPKFVVKAIWR